MKFSISSALVASVSAGCTCFKNLPSKFEASGSAFVNGMVYSVSDEGSLAQWNLDGIFVAKWSTGGSGDWEGLAVTSWESQFLYIAQEYKAKIIEWDLTANKFTGKSWSFPGFPEDSGAGLEGVTYVASTDEWWAGSQSNGKVYRYTCDLSASGACTQKSGTYGNWGLGEVSGLGYDFNSDTVYVVSDDDDKYVQVSTTGGEIRRGSVAISHCEGIAPMPDGKFLLSDDGGSLVSCDLTSSVAV
jgi:uncharacterized protein YjiK